MARTEPFLLNPAHAAIVAGQQQYPGDPTLGCLFRSLGIALAMGLVITYFFTSLLITEWTEWVRLRQQGEQLGAPIVESIFYPIWLVFFNVVPLGILVAKLRQRAWERRLAAQGRVLGGHLHQVAAHADREGDVHLTLHYGFHTPAGQELRDKASAYRNDLLGQPLPDVDTPVWVLYADDQTYKLL